MKLRVTHLTRYHYDKPVGFTPHFLYLRPRESAVLRVPDYSIDVQPGGKVVHVRDAQDNNMARAYIWERGDTLVIDSKFTAETLDTNPFDFLLKPYAIKFPFSYDPRFDFALSPYLIAPPEPVQIALRTWLTTHFPEPPDETVPYVTQLADLFFSSIAYARREEEGIQTSLETIALGTGACRDTAVFACELFRTLGVAARFVSGYLYAPPGDDHTSRGAMHAWIEIYLPGAGWKAIDPTHGVFCDDCYIPVAHSATPESVNPIQGVIANDEPATSTMDAEIIIEKLD